jgi:preprotein translocase subunit SecD
MPPENPPSDYPAPTAPRGLGYLPEGYRPAPDRIGPVRRWLRPAAVALAVAVAVGAATTGVIVALRHWNGQPAAGDTALTVHVATSDGTPPSTAALDATKRILLSRMTAAKMTRPSITILGTDTLIVTVAQGDSGQIRALLAAGSLAFRKVLGSVAARPAPSTPPGCPATQETRTDLDAALASAKAKLGPAYELAATIQDPERADLNALSAFTTLTCAEVTALPARIQYAVPTINCAMLDGRIPGAVAAEPNRQVTACDDGPTKYLLDPAKVTNTDLASVQSGYDIQGGGWSVTLHFTAAGEARWTALTREATAGNQTTQVAIVLDNHVLTAPEIMQVITGDAVINGADIDQSSAQRIAASLRFGILPLTLTITAIQRVR